MNPGFEKQKGKNAFGIIRRVFAFLSLIRFKMPSDSISRAHKHLDLTKGQVCVRRSVLYSCF